MFLFKLEYNADFGIDKRTGWSVCVDGDWLCQFEPLEVALGIAAQHVPCFAALRGSRFSEEIPSQKEQEEAEHDAHRS